MSKFRIYRRRPDLITHQIESTYIDESTETEITEVITVELTRPNVPQTVQLAAKMREAQLAVDPRSERFDPSAYARLAVSLLEFVHSVTGLKDEDDREIRWDELTRDEREALMVQLPLDAVLNMTSDLALSGRLDGAKKKPSAPTSPTSTSEAPAAVPAAPEE